MTKLYYNDYFINNNIQYQKGRYNIVTLPCGSGKTFHCLDFITKKREQHELEGRRLGKEANLARCLYVTDTSALKESVIHAYENKTNKRVESTKNIEVITYAKFASLLFQQGEYLARDYDYIFLDEIHQLFLYSDRYDKDEEKGEYQDIIECLPFMVDYTTLICLSATPKPLEEYLDEIDERYKIHQVIPATDFHKIKAYTTTHTIGMWDTLTAIENIDLQPQDKMFIFAATIKELRNLEEVCQKKGYSTLALWSNRYNLMRSDDEEQEANLAMKRMTDYQLYAREKLLTTGEFDEQVILLNGAYESGINIENGKDSEQRTVHVVVCTSCEYTITQARGRVRHNIDCLYYLSHFDDWYESEGKGKESNQALVKRLDTLVAQCKEDKTRFQGKEGLKQIANILNIWFTRVDKKGKNKGRTQAKSIETINDHLMLLELPYEVKLDSNLKWIDGKKKRLSYYVVINKEEIYDEEDENVDVDYTDETVPNSVTHRSRRDRRFA